MEIQKDYLTKFYLRDTFYSSLKELIFTSSVNKKHFSLIFIDVDNFHKLNDKYGHLIGDEILKYFADNLRSFFPHEQSFRFGGDEFVMLLPEKNSEEALDLLLKFKNKMTQVPFLIETKLYSPLNINFSCGIALFPEDGRKMADLIKSGDNAMYFSKHRGRNLITIASKIESIRFRSKLIASIAIGLTLFVLVLLYQFLLKGPMHRLVQNISAIEINLGNKDSGTILLKSGGVLKGTILEESEKQLTINLPAGEGKVLLILDKDEIAEIRK